MVLNLSWSVAPLPRFSVPVAPCNVCLSQYLNIAPGEGLCLWPPVEKRCYNRCSYNRLRLYIRVAVGMGMILSLWEFPHVGICGDSVVILWEYFGILWESVGIMWESVGILWGICGYSVGISCGILWEFPQKSCGNGMGIEIPFPWQPCECIYLYIYFFSVLIV